MGQMITNYNRAPLLLGDVRSRTVTVKNLVASETTLTRGTVLGKNAAGQYVVCKSAATDGSRFPKAILAGDVTLSSEGIASAQVFISGDFNKDLIVLDGSDTLDTLIPMTADTQTVTSTGDITADVGGAVSQTVTVTVTGSADVEIATLESIEDWMRKMGMFVQEVSELTDYDNQ